MSKNGKTPNVCLGQLVIEVAGLSHPHVIVMAFEDGLFSMALAHNYNQWVRIEPTSWATFIYVDRPIFCDGRWDVKRIRRLAKLTYNS